MNPSNLPPGCTDNDIDPPMVDCPECEGTGYGLGFDRLDLGSKPPKQLWCPTCDGTGEVRKDSVQE